MQSKAKYRLDKKPGPWLFFDSRSQNWQAAHSWAKKKGIGRPNPLYSPQSTPRIKTDQKRIWFLFWNPITPFAVHGIGKRE
jgi:hypothetical protein